MSNFSVPISVSGDRYDGLREVVEQHIVKVIQQEMRDGGALREFQPSVNIPNELLHEIIDSKLDERDRNLQEQFTHQLMNAVIQMQSKPQQPGRSPDDLLWKALADAVKDGGDRVENRLIAIIADFAAKNNKPSGHEVYQYLNLAYQRLS